MLKKITLVQALIFILSSLAISQDILINEFMSSNTTTIFDEDGDSSDWIELFNYGSIPINLQNYSISDDSTDLGKWTFPSKTLNPQEYFLLWASGKDIKGANHWETVINEGDNCKYFVGNSEPPVTWKEINFNDNSWLNGQTGVGYGDGDDNTVIPQVTSVYLRQEFTVTDLQNITFALFFMDFDDSFIAYLNGVEIARENISGLSPPFNTLSNGGREAEIYNGGLPLVYKLNNFQNLLVQGQNVLSIQVHNASTTSSDLTAIPFLVLGMENSPLVPQGLNPLLSFAIPNLHTNFNLSSGGEFLVISDSNGQIIDSLTFGQVPSNFSFGRFPNADSTFVIFDQPTPETANVNPGYLNFAEVPNFSQPNGFYQNSITVNLNSNSPNSVIRFSLDGTEPTDTSQVYTNPISVLQTTVLRARSFEVGFLPSEVVTKTYFMNVSKTLPVVSISTTPENLWDENFGIYALGPNADPNYPYFNANFWQDWERPAHTEFFDESGNLGFELDCGIKISGGWSRGHSQKSMSIFARSEYGIKEIEYEIFPDSEIKNFNSFMMRNSGNDWNNTMFRDGVMTSLVDDLNIDLQKFRPAVLYLNGQYWGMLNLREKLNADYIFHHHGVSQDSIDLIKNGSEVKAGSINSFNQLENYFETNNFTDSAVYDSASKMIDLLNFTQYQISQIYFDNTDWPGNNSSMWRKRSSDGKWRWMLFDTDFGFSSYTNNTLDFATEPNGPSWPNPPWSTLYLRKLLENSDYQNYFINEFAYLLNKVFVADSMVANINSKKDKIFYEIQNHLSRWNGGSLSQWNSDIQNMIVFANNRNPYVRNHVINKFGLSGTTSNIYFQVAPSEAADLIFNDRAMENGALSGLFFNGAKMKLKLIPKEGYTFVGWTGPTFNDSLEINFTITDNILKYAIFAIDSTTVSDSIVINEINYNSEPNFDTEDWFEVFNSSSETVNLSSWKITDSDTGNVFVFPDSTFLPPQEFLVICRDTTDFVNFNPSVQNFVGEFNFGLSSNGDEIKLYDLFGTLVDSVKFEPDSLWSSEANGTGKTLSLKDPLSDNSLPENWSISLSPFGTPGEINDFPTSIEEKDLTPKKFSLSQNFPNPFNPTTTINYELRVRNYEKSKLTIFNILGETVKEFEIKKQKGTVVWNGTNSLEKPVSSGIYFYRLESQDFKIVKKMVLLK
ncbi:MAG: T9SS C-terminal target domain-containing protein [Calditrichaeota bacterium]|nr:MAG: T9SS C-terminal target domain-containing protein [Calditrichota bacterium]